ncbi:hypothetical protein NSQ59_04485 [Margalitia sp. FSL K6-0131]|uniref:hypothetical protein n=1 Tax=Margalitia sp. FSL K6-0131 TaxID=2954604 RepID=UPI0030F80D0E
MNRKLEKRLILVGAIWEIISGLITVLFYATSIKKQGLTVVPNMEAMQSIFGSLYMFAVTFGMLFIAIGFINLYLSRQMKNEHVEKKIPIWFIIVGLASYFVMDILGALMFLSAGILALAKNKSVRKSLEAAK